MKRRHWIVFGLINLVGLSLAVAGDEPDLKREAQFHEIYKLYNQNPTPDEQWKKALGDREAQTYKVQDGDTLWDLSETLFGDAQYWPKIWSLNSGDIHNPHEILPQQTVKFFPGSLGEAPALAVTESSKEVQEEETTTPVELDLSNFSLPEPEKKYVPAIDPPESLPAWKFRNVESKEKVDFELKKLTPLGRQREIDIGHYVMEEDLPAIGKIVSAETEMNTATEFQFVVVKLIDEAAELGRSYVVVKEVDSIKSKLLSQKKARVAEVQGIVEVKEVVNSEKSLYRAIIKKAIAPIDVNSELIQVDWPRVSLDGGEKGPDVQAEIFGGEYSSTRNLFSRDSIVYLNAGSNEGLAEGQVFPIFASGKARSDKPEVTENLGQVGRAKIVKVTPGLATAVILDSSDGVRIGDRVANQ